LEAWKAAVVNGDQPALAKLYSATPVHLQVGKDPIALKDEWAFWTGMKRSGLTDFNPRVLEVGKGKGNTRLLLRISATLRDSHLTAAWCRSGRISPMAGNSSPPNAEFSPLNPCAVCRSRPFRT
jgi:hypothetical protein